jgi:hypothetical protein
MQLMLSRADGSQEFPLVLDIPGNPRIESEFLIGRAPDCDVHLMEPSVSRHHCGIVVDTMAQSLRVRDKGSRNGTFVNDQPVLGMCALQDGDTLTVGFVPLTIRISSDRSLWDNASKRCRAAQIAKPRRIEFGLSNEKAYAADHPTLAARYLSLAVIEQDLGNLPEARRSMRIAYAMWSARLGEKHAFTQRAAEWLLKNDPEFCTGNEVKTG